MHSIHKERDYRVLMVWSVWDHSEGGRIRHSNESLDQVLLSRLSSIRHELYHRARIIWNIFDLLPSVLA